MHPQILGSRNTVERSLQGYTMAMISCIELNNLTNCVFHAWALNIIQIIIQIKYSSN